MASGGVPANGMRMLRIDRRGLKSKLDSVNAATLRQLLAQCRRLLATAESIDSAELDIHRALGRLRNVDGSLISNELLLAEFMDFADAVFANRGPARQYAAKEFSKVLNWVMRRLHWALASDRDPLSDPTSPRDHGFGEITEESLRHAMEVFKRQALRMVQGRPSRSFHLASLRADAWSRLRYYLQHAEDPELVSTAIKSATRRSSDPIERCAAIDFLGETGSGDCVDENVAATLEAIAADPPDRQTLREAMQAMVRLGLADEMSALGAVWHWDDTPSHD